MELKNQEGWRPKQKRTSSTRSKRAADRAVVIQTLDGNSVLLREVRTALARIDEGTVGQCLRCEEAIRPKRLAAIPWAGLCLKCQEEADLERDRKRANHPPFLELATLMH